MEFEILEQGAFQSALVHCEAGERVVSESGAMVRASGNVDIDVTTRAKKGGGLLSGVKRMLGGDSFFLSTYTTTDGAPGEVGIAPILPGVAEAPTMAQPTSRVIVRSRASSTWVDSPRTASSLSSVPTVWPRPRPEIIGT